MALAPDYDSFTSILDIQDAIFGEDVALATSARTWSMIGAKTRDTTTPAVTASLTRLISGIYLPLARDDERSAQWNPTELPTTPRSMLFVHLTPEGNLSGSVLCAPIFSSVMPPEIPPTIIGYMNSDAFQRSGFYDSAGILGGDSRLRIFSW